MNFKRFLEGISIADQIAARQAKLRSARELEGLRQRREEVDNVTANLERLRKRNGFGEAIEQAMRRKRPV